MIIILLIISSLVATPDCTKIDEIRESYHQIDSENKLQLFLKKMDKFECVSGTPYRASAIMQQARYADFPINKLRYFNKGKKLLEKYIDKYPHNPEARYVRILIQSQVPAILNYNRDMKSDIDFVLKKLPASDMPADYKQLILKNINQIIKNDNE